MTRRALLAALLATVLGAGSARAVDFGNLFKGLNIVSVEQEAQIAGTFAKDVESKKRFARDPAVRQFVNEIGARLARSRRSDFPWRFRVMQDPEVNAYNIGGGYVYVNTGLLAAARSEGEVAAVIAHEMGHQTKRHVAKTISRQHVFQSLAAFATGGQGSQWVQLAAGLGITTGQLHFGREAEREADKVMVDTMLGGGYDPRQALAMFDTLRRIQGNRGGIAFLSSHPPTKERAASVRQRISERRIPSGLTTDSRRFHDIKTRLQ